MSIIQQRAIVIFSVVVFTAALFSLAIVLVIIHQPQEIVDTLGLKEGDQVGFIFCSVIMYRQSVSTPSGTQLVKLIAILHYALF